MRYTDGNLDQTGFTFALIGAVVVALTVPVAHWMKGSEADGMVLLLCVGAPFLASWVSIVYTVLYYRQARTSAPPQRSSRLALWALILAVAAQIAIIPVGIAAGLVLLQGESWS